MPNSVVKSYAKKSGKSIDEVEKIWNESKKEAMEKFGKEDEHFWAYVNKVTHNKVGLKEHKISFKEFLGEKKKGEGVNKKEQNSLIKVGDSVQLTHALKGIEATIGEIFTVADVADNGDIKITNSFGPEYHDKYFDKKHFKLVEEK